MDWWRNLLTVLVFIGAGLLAGFLISLMILRLQKRPWPFFSRQKRSRVARNMPAARPVGSVRKSQEGVVTSESAKPPQTPDVLTEFVAKHGETTAAGDKMKAAQLHDAITIKHRKTTIVEDQKPAVPALVAEVEANLAIATTPWTGNLLAFQTKVWDNNHEVSPNSKEELTEAYADIRLANNIVWLSTEVGRRSKELDEGYLSLRAKIAERLNQTLPTLKS